LLSLVVLNESILPGNVGWRLSFGLGVVLGKKRPECNRKKNRQEEKTGGNKSRKEAGDID